MHVRATVRPTFTLSFCIDLFRSLYRSFSISLDISQSFSSLSVCLSRRYVVLSIIALASHLSWLVSLSEPPALSPVSQSLVARSTCLGEGHTPPQRAEQPAVPRKLWITDKGKV